MQSWRQPRHSHGRNLETVLETTDEILFGVLQINVYLVENILTNLNY